ncbi:MAG: hypothetical protein JXB29_01815, partial [Sedimentisphaerales bacterium]|nr:hypothetical protein [Sedimentisphaerales bacterium]
ITSLNLITFFPAIAKTTPQANVAVGNFDSISWWLGYAVQQADIITDPNCKDDVYGLLGRMQAMAGDVDGANASASAISNRRGRIYVHIAAAKISYKKGNISGYKKSMEQAKSAALSKGSVESQIFMNSNMIIAYLDCNDVNGATSYTETLRDNPEVQKGYHDVQLAYRKIAAYLACNGNVKDANFVVNNNIKPSGKDAALVEIAETCVRKGNIAVAEQFVERITRVDYRDRVYEKIGSALAESGDIKKAYAVAEKITDFTHKSFVISAIAKYQITSGDIDLGKKTAKDITYRDHKIAVYTLIAEKQAEAGKIDSAVATIEMMAKMIDDIPVAADKSKFGTFDDSFKKGLVETVYLCVAKASAQTGDVENYNKYITKATEGVKEINDVPVWKGTIFIGIVDAQLEANDIEGAKKTVKEIKEEHNRSWALFNVVKTQLEKGDIEGAVTTSKEIMDTMNKSFACGEIASAFVKKGELTEAKKVLLCLGNSSREAEAYRRTATAFVETGHVEELANWLNEIPSPQARVYACTGAVDGIMKHRKNRPNSHFEN